MNQFMIGQRYPDHANHADGMEIHLGNTFIGLECYINQPNREERAAFDDTCTLRIGVLGELVFMTLDFTDKMTFDQSIYVDQSFFALHTAPSGSEHLSGEAGQSGEGKPRSPISMPKQGFNIVIRAYDEEGTLLSVRYTSLSYEMSCVIRDLFTTMFSQQADEQRLMASIMAFNESTPEQLKEIATCTYTLEDKEPYRTEDS